MHAAPHQAVTHIHTIIGWDTASPVFQAALATSDGYWSVEVDAGQRHADMLIDVTAYLVQTAGLTPRDLECAVCMQGPGSFTGLRIGYAAAKGLAFAQGIPLIAVPTLDCMAGPVWPGIVAPVIDAKKGCYYTALYRGGERLTPWLDVPPPVLAARLIAARHGDEPVLVTGPDAPLAVPILAAALVNAAGDAAGAAVRLDPAYRRGRARELIAVARHELAGQRRADRDLDAGPVYIRTSDAELMAGA